MTETPGSNSSNPEEKPLSNAELKALVESNARSIAANGQQMATNHAETDRKINNLANVVQAFIAKLDSEGLRVTLITDVADDMAGEVAEIERNAQRHDVSIEALRADAIADREAFREEMASARAKADEDRQAFSNRIEAANAKADEDREAWQKRADADRQVFREEMASARAKADEDREESDRRFDEAIAQIDRLREESNQKFTEQKAESDQRYQEQLAEIRALGEQNRALLSALAANNRRVDDLEQAG